MGGSSSIRLHSKTYKQLKVIQKDGESLLDTLNRILPEDVDEIERIDEDVVAIPTPPEVSQRVKKMAGQNVSANDVVAELIAEYEDEVNNNE